MRRATTDLVTALAGGYIGETHLTPQRIANAVHLAVTGRQLRNVVVFYYGDHDSELDELFGWAPPKLGGIKT